MQIFRFPFQAMACACEVVLAAPDLATARAIAQTAIDEVVRIEYKYSRYRCDSIVSQINAAAGHTAVSCDDETWTLLAYADTLYQLSDGLFDITAGVLRRVWDFKVARVPCEDELASVRQLIGWTKVERAAGQIRLGLSGMEIDFGGFGKEYAADRAGEILLAQGARHGYLNLGGDMRVIGPKPDGLPWMMGIQDPRRQDQIIATIPIEQGGLATSGDYEKYFEIDAQRYCHILDPGSGQPVRFWRTISVIAPLTIVAGSCSTIAMLKQENGLDYLKATGMRYLALDQHGSLHMNQS